MRQLEHAVGDRFAFTAQFWGESAVIGRAIEDKPGTVVEPQFGEFATWTQANAFAAKLNEGLGIDACVARQIVTSAFLAKARVIQAASNSDRSLKFSGLRADCQTTNVHFLLSELSLALTYCDATGLVTCEKSRRVVRNAHTALLHASDFMLRFDGDPKELEGLATTAGTLSDALRQLPFPMDSP